MGVGQISQVISIGFPVHNQLAFADLFTHALAQGVETDDGTVLYLHQFHETSSFEHLRFGVTQQIRFFRNHVARTVDLFGAGFGQPHRGDFGFTESHARNIVVLYYLRGHPRNFFGDENALHHGAVSQLQSRHNVTHCIDIPHSGVQAFIG